MWCTSAQEKEDMRKKHHIFLLAFRVFSKHYMSNNASKGHERKKQQKIPCGEEKHANKINPFYYLLWIN